MIYINREGWLPPVFKHAEFKKIKQGLIKFYGPSIVTRRQKLRPDVLLSKKVYRELIDVLESEFRNKCAYCESKLANTNLGGFDHFRPKSSARGMKGNFSNDHYWWLVYHPQNLFLCCNRCNRFKLNWFPVSGKRSAIDVSYKDTISGERALLINPGEDYPALHLKYDMSGKIFGITRMGEMTIEVLKLNRLDLVIRRKEACKSLVAILTRMIIGNGRFASLNYKDKDAIEAFYSIIDDLSKPIPTIAFAGLHHYFIYSWYSQYPKVFDELGPKGSSTKWQNFLTKTAFTTGKFEDITRTRVKKNKVVRRKSTTSILYRVSIEKIEIKNFKSIEHLIIPFPEVNKKGEPWLMLLGENGVGKSSFLQAVSMALMGSNYFKNLGLKAQDIYRRGATEEGYVKIFQSGKDPIMLYFDNMAAKHNIKTPPCYLLGYGSTRLFSTAKIKPERSKGLARTRNMFEPDCALFAEDWLVKLAKDSKPRFDYACKAIKAMLRKEIEDEGMELIVRKGEIWLIYSNEKKQPDRLRELSDGYKSVIALACDMMQALLKEKKTMEVAEGIVLVDEVGTHLHPRWKMRVVNSLRAAFPRLQFIVTTHDPLCLKGLTKGEVAVFDKDSNDKVFAIHDLPDPSEFRAEQLLSSRFFGLLSTIDEELERDFNEYYQLLGKDGQLLKREEKRLVELKEMLRGKNHLGDSLREELALTAADTLLSAERLRGGTKPVSELQIETTNLLAELWEKPIDEQKKITKA